MSKPKTPAAVETAAAFADAAAREEVSPDPSPDRPAASKAHRLFRCMNCRDPNTGLSGREFEAPAGRPVCPHCGVGEHHATAGLVVPLAVIHFDPPSGAPGKGKNYTACDPRQLIGVFGVTPTAAFHATGVTSAVTCPACKETKEFRDAHAGAAADPMYDLPTRR